MPWALKCSWGNLKIREIEFDGKWRAFLKLKLSTDSLEKWWDLPRVWWKPKQIFQKKLQLQNSTFPEKCENARSSKFYVTKSMFSCCNIIFQLSLWSSLKSFHQAQPPLHKKASTYNTYIASQHCTIRDVSADMVRFGFKGCSMKALCFWPLFQSHEYIAQAVIDSLDRDEK